MALALGLTACSDEVFDAPRTDVPENGEIPVAFAVPKMEEVTTRGISEDAFGKVTMLMYDQKDGKLIKAEDLTLNSNKTTITIPENYRKTGGLYFLFFANDEKSKADFNANETSGGENMSVAMQISNDYYSISDGSDGENLTLSGACTLSDLLQLSPVGLYHNAAKITVLPYEEGSDMKFEYQVYGTAANSKLMAGSYNSDVNNSAENYCGSHSEVTGFVSFGEDHDHNLSGLDAPCDTYVHPTLNNDGDDLNKSYVIVRCKCTVDSEDETYYYYCLQFQKEDVTGALNILPNHYYKFLIHTDKIGKGYLTQEEALSNPVPLSSGMYVVYDHSPQIYNIVTDGVRALGVSDKLYHSGDAGIDCFYIKLFSKEQNDGENDEYGQFKTDFRDLIKFNDNTWVELKSCDFATGDDLGTAGANTFTDDDNNFFSDATSGGVIFKVTCNFKGSPAGTQTTVGTVTWKGLSRKFEVEWNRAFDSSDLYKSVTASFTENSTYSTRTPSISGNYFDWIGGVLNDDGTAYTTMPKVWGADSKSNNGDPRDRGFHFPMQGGGKIKYTVKLKDELPGDGDYTWTYLYEGDDALKTNTTVTIDESQKGSDNVTSKTLNGVGPIFTIEWTGGDSYDYLVANLVIRIQKSGLKPQDHRIPLYHTGFFLPASGEKSENSYYKNNTTSGDKRGLAKELESGRDWTYYEIVTIERGENKKYHVLDRNLGAHSAEMYVEATGDVAYAGDAKAAGGYYRVGLYDRGNDPKVENLQEKIGAPSNFDIPEKEVFDDIRKSSNFSTASVGAYYTALYAANYYGPKDANGNRKRKTVYFPKARYLNGANEKQGDSRAGYYWTKTASSGLEKEEVGAWLDAFTLTGSSTSYSRGEVYCSTASTTTPGNHQSGNNEVRTGEISGYAMPVRLILSEDNSAGSAIHQTNFFVKGATHVFLYTIDSKGKRTAVTSWPGYSICPAAQASSNKYNFRYESKVNDSKDLYAIFNYQTASGAIYSMSYLSSNNKKARFTNDENPNSLIGFNLGGVNQAAIYDSATGERISPAYNNGSAPDYSSETAYGNNAPVKITNGSTWTFNFKTTALDTSKGGIGEAAGYVPPTPPNYRIYWPKSYGGNSTSKGMNIFKSDAKDGSGGIELKKQSFTSYSSSGDYYYYEFAEDDFNKTYVHVQVYDGNSYGNKPYILKTSFLEEDIDGTTYKCYTVDTTVNDTESPASGQGGKPSGTPLPSTYTIYYTNPAGWSNVKVHVKKNGSTCDGYSNYPGNAMTKDGDKWKATIPQDATALVFNNGGSANTDKTADVSVVKTDGYTYSTGPIETPAPSGDKYMIKWPAKINSDDNFYKLNVIYSDGTDMAPFSGITLKGYDGTKNTFGDNAWWDAESNGTKKFGFRLNSAPSKAFYVTVSNGSKSYITKQTYTKDNFSTSNKEGDYIVLELGSSSFEEGVVIKGDYNMAYNGSKSNIHYWGGSSATSWPGETMSSTSGSDGNTYKVAKVASETKQCIFNGSDQTGDLNYSGEYVMGDSGPTSKKVKFVSSASSVRRRPVKASAKSAVRRR